LEENFKYGSTSAAELITVAPTWARHSGSQGPQYSYLGLDYTGYPSSDMGGSCSFTSGSSGTNDGDINRTFTGINTTSTLYVSFLVNLISAKNTVDYFFHLSQNPFSTSTFRGRVFAIANGTGWNIGVTKQATSSPTINTTTILNFGQIYLVVMKYQFNTASASDDVVSLYVYASGIPTSESSSNLLSIVNVNDGVNDPSDIGAVAVRQGGNCPTGLIDGIRVSDNWGLAVTGVPSDVEENNSVVPTSYSLSQNYPNPFNPSTVISYQLSAVGNVQVKVSDMLGREVTTLVNEEKPAGRYQINWNGTDNYGNKVTSGVYFYTLKAGNYFQTKKMMFLK
jgi:hypothetical protein